MSINISEVISGLATRQLKGLILVLQKANQHATESGIDHATLLGARLYPDMYPLSQQINTAMELLLRGVARLTGKEVIGLNLEDDNFSDLIAKIEGFQQDLLAFDNALLNQSEDKMFDVPIGVDGSIPMIGKEYVLRFLLPNFYFHLTTAYDLLRMSGVPLGKRDYMGVA